MDRRRIDGDSGKAKIQRSSRTNPRAETADAELRLLSSLCRKPESPVVSGTLIDVTNEPTSRIRKTGPTERLSQALKDYVISGSS